MVGWVGTIYVDVLWVDMFGAKCANTEHYKHVCLSQFGLKHQQLGLVLLFRFASLMLELEWLLLTAGWRRTSSGMVVLNTACRCAFTFSSCGDVRTFSSWLALDVSFSVAVWCVQAALALVSLALWVGTGSGVAGRRWCTWAWAVSCAAAVPAVTAAPLDDSRLVVLLWLPVRHPREHRVRPASPTS